MNEIDFTEISPPRFHWWTRQRFSMLDLLVLMLLLSIPDIVIAIINAVLD
jgi:hypothetical protein